MTRRPSPSPYDLSSLIAEVEKWMANEAGKCKPREEEEEEEESQQAPSHNSS
jgi:hypothetical protein